MAKASKQDMKDDAIKADLIDTALSMIADKGWVRTTMFDVARKSGTPISKTMRLVPTKLAVMDALETRIDRTMLEALDRELEMEGPRERLFEVMMARFDAMQQNRTVVIAMLKGLLFDPVAAAALARRHEKSLQIMLEAAGLESPDLDNIARRRALDLVFADTLRAWMSDDSEDLSKTMAALDRRLTQLEGAVFSAGAIVASVMERFSGDKSEA